MLPLLVMQHTLFGQQIFLLAALLLIGFFTWQMFLPFFAALAVAAIVVVVSYPAYELIVRYTPRHNRSVAALITTLLVLCLIIIPLFAISSLLVSEFLSLVNSFNTVSPDPTVSVISQIENTLTLLIPGFDIDVNEQIKQSFQWFTRNAGGIFSGAVSVVLALLITILGLFYSFKDGVQFRNWLLSITPLSRTQGNTILDRLAVSVRSVVTGTILLSIIQGLVATTGFMFFGIERAVLWGAVGAFGALLPGVGLAGIMVPAIGYLFYTGATTAAIGLLIYAVVAIGVVDNLLGPYLMSRGNKLHPFIVMLSVLGGISLFGPIGFILGPVIVTLFLVILDLYSQVPKSEHVADIKHL